MYKKEYLFIQIFILDLLLVIIFNLQCGNEEIDHCLQCGTGENSDICVQCENKYFLFFNNHLCIPCDHKIYGNIGCGGNCDGSKYKEIGNVLCEENKCKEGYYNLEGICMKCSIGSEFCIKCSYLSPYGSNEKKYICNECINDKYQVLDDGRCHHCSINNCTECHYPALSKNPICDSCVPGFYINSNGTCSKCNRVYITNGYCTVCSDDLNNYENRNCTCYSGSHLINNFTCISCPKNCDSCKYNETLKEYKCLRCRSRFTLNSNNECISCGNHCRGCQIDDNQIPICKSCDSGYMLNDNKECISCPENCSQCKKNKDELIECTNCFSFYGLNPQKKCVRCPTNCRSCYYRNKTNDFGCSYCEQETSPFYYNYHFTIGENEQCISCKSISEIGANGCDECSYYKTSNKYSCISCLNKYIMISNDKHCRLPKDIGLSDYCEKGINLGTLQNPKYSCTICKDYTIPVKYQNGITNCHEPEGNLVNCLEAKEDSKGILQCNKCVSNFQFIYNNEYSQYICDSKCAPDSFFKNNFCYKCNDSQFGNIGCIGEEGCNYISSNDQLNCNQCKKGYFNYAYGQCFLCSNENNLCEECHINIQTNKYECEKCIEGYILNEETKKCDPI